MTYELQAYPFLDDVEDIEEIDFRPATATRMPFQQLSALLQRARQDHNLLDQSEVWVNGKGLKIELREMSARYASNVLAWMRKNAKVYHSSWATWEFITKYADQSATDFEELLDQTVTDKTAREWLKETTLYKALVEVSKHPV